MSPASTVPSPSPGDAETRRWNVARELFLDLLELPQEERTRVLEERTAGDPPLRAWVERLLEQDSEASSDLLTEPAPEPERRTFGPYEEVRHIASGGMGEVYLARRVDGEFEREVAVKLLRRGAGGEDLVRRFLRERQTLAQLDHEYVARPLDGGTTEEGHPYLVMEYVDGKPIDVFCREHGLGVRERIELFRRVAAAVQHAHDRGVVHRDLKPSNILVRPDGRPRLLDFGIARPTEVDAAGGAEPITRTGHRIFTPEYASPEQVRGEPVSRATDVFSLGVLLYLLLTGKSPWSLGLSRPLLELSICEDDPAPPSRRRTGTARRALAGDLDTIVLKCLAKDPDHRYASVAELADDLGRHQDGYPIRARRTGVARRAWRYARRRPWHVVAAAGVGVAVVAGALAVRTGLASERQERELRTAIEARIEAARKDREQGDLDAAREGLLAALEALGELQGAELLVAEAHGQLAVVANHARDYDEALAQLAEARAHLPADPSALGTDGAFAREEERLHAFRLGASLMNSRSYALAASGRKSEARASAEEALAHCRAHLPAGDELTLDALLELSAQDQAAGDRDSAIARLAEAAEEVRGTDDPRSENLGAILNAWGLVLAESGRHAEALPLFEEALDVLSWHLPERHVWIAQVRANYAVSLQTAGRLEAAFDQFERSLQGRLAHYDEPHADVAWSREQLAETATRLGRHDEAAEQLSEAARLRAVLEPPDPPKLGLDRYLLLLTLDAAGRSAEAEAAAREFLAGGYPGLHGAREMQGDAHFRIGRILLERGEADAAHRELDRALEILEQELGPDDPATQRALELLLGEDG